MSSPHIIFWDEWSSGWEVGPDTASVGLALTPSSVEEYTTLDASTEAFALTASSTEEHTTTDANTESLLLTPLLTAEEHTTFDSATESLLLTPTDTQAFAGVDAATEPLALTASGSDIAQFVDSQTEPLALIPTSTDIGVFVDAATETLGLTGSGTDTEQMQDSATESLFLAPTSSDILQATEAASELLALLPSALENYGRTDAATETISLVASGVDTGQFVDLATERLAFIPSGVDVFTTPGAETGTESLILTASSVDQLDSRDAATIPVNLSPYVIEEFPYIPLALSPSAADTAQFVDAPYDVIYSNGGSPYSASSVFAPNHWWAGLLSTAKTGEIQSITLVLSKLGNPTGNMFIEICEDAGLRPGTVLGYGYIDMTTIDESGYASYTIPMESIPKIFGGSQYFIKMRPAEDSSTDLDNYVFWWHSDFGSEFISFDQGASWLLFENGAFLWELDLRIYPTQPELFLIPLSTETGPTSDIDEEYLALTPDVIEALGSSSDEAEVDLLLIPKESNFYDLLDIDFSPRFNWVNNTPAGINFANDTLTVDFESEISFRSLNAILDRNGILGQSGYFDATNMVATLKCSNIEIDPLKNNSGIYLYLDGQNGNAWFEIDIQGDEFDSSKLQIHTYHYDDSNGYNEDIINGIDSTLSVWILIQTNGENVSLVYSNDEGASYAFVTDLTGVAARALQRSEISWGVYARPDVRVKIDINYFSLEFDQFEVDTAQLSDAATAYIKLEPFGLDVLGISSNVDAGTEYLRLTPSAYELYKIYDLIAWIGDMRWKGIAYNRYFAKMEELKYSASILFKRWWSNVS